MNDINIKQLETRLINTSLQKPNIKVNQSKNFEDVLKKIQSNNDEIKFSKHAIDRMNERDVKLDGYEVVKLEEAFKKAEEKGINEALILIGDKGFIASVRNKTVITTISNDKLKENVFTNIDGAVIL
ncbi:TIGR02530 family flagellar biosynthesis protein [Sporanaerobacter acetigenes]|uniref:Flagellar operon protein n=1 Tax=Sporanaerobacter acetigenes DSM 13106 TaxID=1123281 RepID=A0A1M5Y005_9FIRM|nr:TIGR02530 family flagellar biosynthesis protein [Sporanaerobacter acetigenes]SHI05296.1 flagellar operon protein [Sporanaerobacter acetigenes DSM 13106]